MGHKIRGVAGRYINLSDTQIKEAFEKMFARSQFVDVVLTQKTESR